MGDHESFVFVGEADFMYPYDTREAEAVDAHTTFIGATSAG